MTNTTSIRGSERVSNLNRVTQLIGGGTGIRPQCGSKEFSVMMEMSFKRMEIINFSFLQAVKNIGDGFFRCNHSIL